MQILGEVRDRYGFSLVGYVVMPEHIHLLISEPAKGTPSTVIQVLKQRVSRRLRRNRRAPAGQLKLRFEGGEDSLPRFWQRAVLRLQRVESEEESRKAPVHAHESHEAQFGRSPEGLALE